MSKHTVLNKTDIAKAVAIFGLYTVFLTFLVTEEYFHSALTLDSKFYKLYHKNRNVSA